MRRLIINSDIDAKYVAIMCCHVQNVQSHSIIITDNTAMLKYGNIVDLKYKPNTVPNITKLFAKKLDDTLIVVAPDLIGINTADELHSVIAGIEQYISSELLENVDSSVVYLSTGMTDSSCLEEITEKTEGTLVNLVLYKKSSFVNNAVDWRTSSDSETEKTIVGKYLNYTVIFDKKNKRAAAELKNEVIFISPKDYLAVKNAEVTDSWRINGLYKNLTLEIMSNVTGENPQLIQNWIAQDK